MLVFNDISMLNFLSGLAAAVVTNVVSENFVAKCAESENSRKKLMLVPPSDLVYTEKEFSVKLTALQNHQLTTTCGLINHYYDSRHSCRPLVNSAR